jgi:spermidine/putrescine transport system permease protein
VVIGAFVVAFLMRFENFNTTLMLVGSDAPLTIAMFDRLKEGSTPLPNAFPSCSCRDRRASP